MANQQMLMGSFSFSALSLSLQVCNPSSGNVYKEILPCVRVTFQVIDVLGGVEQTSTRRWETRWMCAM